VQQTRPIKMPDHHPALYLGCRRGDVRGPSGNAAHSLWGTPIAKWVMLNRTGLNQNFEMSRSVRLQAQLRGPSRATRLSKSLRFSRGIRPPEPRKAKTPETADVFMAQRSQLLYERQVYRSAIPSNESQALESSLTGSDPCALLPG
jgi:hypothetical protein